MLWDHITRFTSPLFIEVPVPNKENDAPDIKKSNKYLSICLYMHIYLS